MEPEAQPPSSSAVEGERAERERVQDADVDVDPVEAVLRAEPVLDVAERDDREARDRGQDRDRRRERHQQRRARAGSATAPCRAASARRRAAAAARRARRGWGRSGSGSGRAACARAAGSSARPPSTNAKITSDLMIQTPVVSTNWVSASGKHHRSDLCVPRRSDRAARSSSTFALSLGRPRDQVGASPAARARADAPLPARRGRSSATSTSSPSRDAEPLGVGRVELELLRGREEVERGRALGLPRGPEVAAAVASRSEPLAGRRRRGGGAVGELKRSSPRTPSAASSDCSRSCQRTPSAPISSSVSPR